MKALCGTSGCQKFVPQSSMIFFPDVFVSNIPAFSNEWSAWQADPAIRLYEAWSSILPPFIRDNFMDQLIVPKVQTAIAEWQPRTGGPALRGLVFPWLPQVGLRVDILLDDAKRKAKALLRNWVVGDEVPSDMGAWKDVKFSFFLSSASVYNAFQLRFLDQVTGIH